MALGVNRDLDGMVAELITDVSQRLVLLDEQRRIGMSERMDLDVSQVGLHETRSPDGFTDVAPMIRVSIAGGEYPFRWLFILLDCGQFALCLPVL